MRILRKRWILLFLFGGSLFLNLPTARADLTLTLSSGGDTKTFTSSTGIVSYMGPVGGWNFTSTTGIGTPLFPEPMMDLSTSSVTTTGTSNDLIITLVGTGYTAPITGLGVLFGGTLNNATVVYDAYLDSTLLGSMTGNTSPYSGGFSVAVNPSAPYSITQKLTIHDISGGFAFASVDAQVSTPEPASVMFLGTVLLGLAFGCKRKLLGQK